MKVATEKPSVTGTRRYYHRPAREKRSSWDKWVGTTGSERRDRRGAVVTAALVLAALAGVIVWLMG
ncbi:hypothetical protein OKA04_10010 [Luteolibacter flavescens]|uniref:Uncharacterized protein n=1 Tax=Luteolibacter flavescens TaxID=1859460 RepID=A0ABT3FNB5_9BACT|nr:hypothetical protein [Luteolibacter flavescens]MCW1885061.1 hypothetical protein [Luteolibacter flavescens]